jgi:hypothetical protein
LLLVPVLLFGLILPADAAFRRFEPIAEPRVSADVPRGRVLRPVSRAKVEEAVERLLEAWNGSDLASVVGETFYDRSRLLDAVDQVVPRDATLRLLSIQGHETLAQEVRPVPGVPDSLDLWSTVSVTLRTQLEYNDPIAGFQRLEGLNEYILKIRERVARAALREAAEREAGGPSWSVKGRMRLRASLYEVQGKSASSPYPFDGFQAFDDFHVEVRREGSGAGKFLLEADGALNRSDYRSRYDGVVPDRVRLLREDSGWVVPLRVELGDVYGFFTPRTLQMALKGVRLEVQPGGGPVRHSLVAVAGANERNWRGLRLGSDAFLGISHLVEHPRWGRWVVSLVENLREAGSGTTADNRNQTVLGVATEQEARVRGHRLVFEGELSYLNGEVEGSGWGFFAQARGRGGLPVTYLARFESYARAYAPHGSRIVPDRLSQELLLRWPATRRFSLSGRIQHYRLAASSDDPTDNTTVGVRASYMPPWSRWRGARFRLEAYVQDLWDETGFVDQRSWNLRLDGSSRLRPGIGLRGGLFIQEVSDATGTGADRTTLQVEAGCDLEGSVGGVEAHVVPGLVVRSLDLGATRGTEFFPKVSASLAKGAHALQAAIGYNRQERNGPAAEDVGTFNLDLGYTYRSSLGVFELSVAQVSRRPDGSAGTDSYHVAAGWTYPFSRVF